MDSGSDTASVKSGLINLTDLTKDEATKVEEDATKGDLQGDRPEAIASAMQMQIDGLDRASVLIDQLNAVLFSADDTESSQSAISSDSESTLMYEGMDADDILRIEYGEDAKDDENIDSIEPIESDSILNKTEFLSNFRLPSISEISSEITGLQIEDIEDMTQAKSQDEAIKDEPIEEVVQTEDQVDASDKDAEYIRESSASSQDSIQDKWPDLSLDSGDDDLLELYDDSSLFNIKEVDVVGQAVEDAFIKFKAGYSNHQIFQEDDVPEIDPLKAKEHQEMIQVTIEFIYALFDSVVDRVENRYKMFELENKLDKKRLLCHMISLRNKLSYEYDICRYLNNKMFEYFKRLKTTRSFNTLDPETQVKEFKRYGAALDQLDYWLKVAAATKQRNALLISSVYMDLTYVRNMVLHTDEHLEETIRKTLATNKSESMQHFVERELRLMTQMRNQISDTRLFLITRKHTLAGYIEKTRKLERISDELCMDDFIYINNQVIALDKKIEERNSELKRMRNNYHSELHEIQHNREKTLSLQTRLLDWQDIYSQKLTIRDTLRRKLFDAKITHSLIRKHHADLTYHGGLLAMPGLMHDYDETLARVEDKQAKIKMLKDTFKQVSQRLVELETRGC